MRNLVRMRCQLILFCILLFVSVNISYFAMARGSLDDPAIADASHYVALLKGDISGVPKPFRYRLFTPIAASLVPDLPNSLQGVFDIDSEKQILFKFGVVNTFGIAIAAFFLLNFIRDFDFSLGESLLGSLFFITSFYVANFATTPLVDAWGYALLMAGVYFGINRSWLLYGFTISLGAMTKETTLLALVFVIAFHIDNKRVIMRGILATLPGLIIYFLLQIVILPTDLTYPFGVEHSIRNLMRLNSIRHVLRLAIEFFLTFNIMWLFAVLGWIQIRNENLVNPFHRLFWVIPLILVLPFVLGTNFGRIWFLSFPAVIPLAIQGLDEIVLTYVSDTGETM